MTLELDPAITAVLAQLPELPPAPPVGDVAARRAIGEAILTGANEALPVVSDVTFREVETTAVDGTPIAMRWYTKAGESAGPAALYFHGGGYIQGHIEMFDRSTARYVSESGVPLLLVEYRRAPEHPYPTPVEDGYAALQWLHENASELGVDPDRIAVMGDSAGAGLAASLAVLARQRGGPGIARQILIMPMLDDRTRNPDPQIAGVVNWTYDDNVTAWGALLGDAAGGPDVPATAAPARLEDASGLPPAYIEVGQIDIFRDEDLRYALTLSRSGVPVEFHMYPGALHEFDGVAPDSELARRAVAPRIHALKSI